MRSVFSIILIFHGFIHILGFIKALKPHAVKQLSKEISKAEGIVWLAASILISITVVLFLLKNENWWISAIPALIISQALIIISWQDAKFGTLANVVLLAGIILSYASWRFDTRVNKEFRAFYPEINSPSTVMTRALPANVKKWLDRANVPGKASIQTVCIHQEGEMRTNIDSEWSPFTAKQVVRTSEPGFIWLATMQADAGIHVSARDKYLDGKGNMLVKLLSMIEISNATGPEIDQGAMLRYLCEMIWYPTAATSGYIQWDSTGTQTARATMRYKNAEARALFYFNAAGDVSKVEAMRYYYRAEGSTLEKWICSIGQNEFITVNDIRIPKKASVIWGFTEGDFNWLNLELTNVDYNISSCN